MKLISPAKALTLHPKATLATVAAIAAKYIIKITEAKTSLDFGEDAISDFTILLVAVGAWLAPSRETVPSDPPPTPEELNDAEASSKK